MADIMSAIEHIHAGERSRARSELEALWSSLGKDPDALHVCVLSHFLADLQDDVLQELKWDIRALQSAGQLTDDRLREFHPSLSVAGFLPSLHLNLADAYFRSGDLESAQMHLKTCYAVEAGLSDSSYDTLTRKGIANLAARLRSTQN
ncbi:hypothetical protein [Asticcacaulis sp.]|uniref:hypothetical protein n=1 Tax=Asticcacaulis sp. TaxID=1872648 RepID=UPI00391D900C